MGLKPFKDNVYAKVGREFEKPILDYYWGHTNYESFNYEDYNGDMFPNLPGFNGLVDGIAKNAPLMAEVKTYFWRKKLPQKYYSPKKQRSYRSLSEDYYLQTRFYLWALNQHDPNCPIKEARVLTLFIADVNHPEIVPKYLDVFKVFHDPRDGFDKLIKKAVTKKTALMKPYQDENGNTYYQCEVAYDQITKQALTLIQDVNLNKLAGEKIELDMV